MPTVESIVSIAGGRGPCADKTRPPQTIRLRKTAKIPYFPPLICSTISSSFSTCFSRFLIFLLVPAKL